MAYRYRRRRYTYRRRPYRRTYRRTYNTRRRYNRKSVYNKVQLVKRLGMVRGTSGADHLVNDGASKIITFSLDLTSASDDFTRLYNEYKIRAVKVSFIPLANVSTLDESAYSSLFYSAIDINGVDVNTPAPTRAELREYQGVKWTPYNRIHSRYFFPKPSLFGDFPHTYSIATLGGKQPWISTKFPAISYQSLLISPPEIQGLDPSTHIYKVECTYYLSFRNTK